VRCRPLGRREVIGRVWNIVYVIVNNVDYV